ncbi:hypothetical protein, partial [Bordetella bronchiseptica]|uniref:hypothetical protein n=1 Tax=Bordetella bronchiseptica TaxID=518 RepID=UPI001F393F9B
YPECRDFRAARPDAIPTCHGCLLHPPPLVDLARDRKISGFFFAATRGAPYAVAARIRLIGVFPEVSLLREGGKLYNRLDGSRPGSRRAETLLSVLATCTSLLLPYMGVTPAADNDGLVSIDQPKVTL